MNKAEREILRHVQRESLKEEIAILQATGSGVRKGDVARTGKGQIKKSSRVSKLDPWLMNGLLRVGGRLENAPLQLDAKHPIILPASHQVVCLIISYYHHTSGHSGTEHVLSMIREKFWIVKARAAVRKFLNACFDCRRRQAPIGEQKMANLPKDRITPDKPPFSYVGIDCFGPFLVRCGRSKVKRYGVLFTCLTIRAIHIEVVDSLDNSMRRFIARRGKPEQMRLDNGRNYCTRREGAPRCYQRLEPGSDHRIPSPTKHSVDFQPPCRLSPQWHIGMLHSHRVKGNQCSEGTSP